MAAACPNRARGYTRVRGKNDFVSRSVHTLDIDQQQLSLMDRDAINRRIRGSGSVRPDEIGRSNARVHEHQNGRK